MHINKIKIQKYKTLENLEIPLQFPNGKSVVNVIAGINGSGKTSILDLIFNSFASQNDQSNATFKITFNDELILEHQPEMAQMSNILDINNNFVVPNSQFLAQYILNISNQQLSDIFPKIIYLPAEMPNKRMRQQIPATIIKNSFAFKIPSEALIDITENYIKDFIVSKALDSEKTTKKERLDDAVKEFNDIFLGINMTTKLSGLSSTLGIDGVKPVFKSLTGEDIFLENLSSGEILLFTKIATLLQIEPKNSIILIDEPEMSLHPSWQRKIIKIYENFPGNNQFIISTHSPHILASVNFKNIILLTKNSHTNKIEKRLIVNAPLSLDINNILKELMGSDFINSDLRILHEEYRKIVENGKENTGEAHEIKRKILEYESDESEFMQEMNFLVQLKKM